MRTHRHSPLGSASVTTSNPPRLPFGDGNAASQWHPAMTAINAYAQKQKLGTVSYKGTGVMARGITPPVNAIELQSLRLTTPDGKTHELGTILPEGAHLQEIKSTAELVAEMKQLIAKFVRGRG